jgi:hypothetical protein
MKERGLLPLPAAPPSVDAWECQSAVRKGEEAPKWKRMQENSSWESICTVVGTVDVRGGLRLCASVA